GISGAAAFLCSGADSEDDFAASGRAATEVLRGGKDRVIQNVGLLLWRAGLDGRRAGVDGASVHRGPARHRASHSGDSAIAATLARVLAQRGGKHIAGDGKVADLLHGIAIGVEGDFVELAESAD